MPPQERLVSALAQRSSSCGPGPPSCALEVAFLAANLGATALLVIVSNLRQVETGEPLELLDP